MNKADVWWKNWVKNSESEEIFAYLAATYTTALRNMVSLTIHHVSRAIVKGNLLKRTTDDRRLKAHRQALMQNPVLSIFCFIVTARRSLVQLQGAPLKHRGSNVRLKWLYRLSGKFWAKSVHTRPQRFPSDPKISGVLFLNFCCPLLSPKLIDQYTWRCVFEIFQEGMDLKQ